jgi:hypothetical protein
MKTQRVFKLEQAPDGFSQIFSPNCKITIEKTEGQLYLNYENRNERIVGHYKNLRREGEVFLADIELFDHLKPIENRFEFSIEGSVTSKNDKGEAESVVIKRAAALMHNKF